MWWQLVCLPNLCQNASNQSNLAHKRPKRSNSTKIEIRLKTSKTATECLKPLGNGFLWPSTKTNSSFRRNFFWSKSCKNAPKHLKLAQKRQIRSNSTKFWNWLKTSKNCWKLTLVASNLKVNISCVMTKRSKSFKTYYETTETSKMHKKLKCGQKR